MVGIHTHQSTAIKNQVIDSKDYHLQGFDV